MLPVLLVERPLTSNLYYIGTARSKYEAVAELKLLATSNQLLGVAVEYRNQWDTSAVGVCISAGGSSWYIPIRPDCSDLLNIFFNLLSYPHLTKKYHDPMKALVALTRGAKEHDLATADATNIIDAGSGSLCHLGASMGMYRGSFQSTSPIAVRGEDTIWRAKVTAVAPGELPDPYLALLVHGASRVKYKPPRVRADGLPWGTKRWKLVFPPRQENYVAVESEYSLHAVAMENREQRLREGRPTS